MLMPLEMRTSPPTATTFSCSTSGAAISRSESYCSTESASMQMKYGYCEALMPMFSASDLPPLSLEMSVTGMRPTCPYHTLRSGAQGTWRRMGRSMGCRSKASMTVCAVPSVEPSSTTITS